MTLEAAGQGSRSEAGPGQDQGRRGRARTRDEPDRPRRQGIEHLAQTLKSMSDQRAIVFAARVAAGHGSRPRGFRKVRSGGRLRGEKVAPVGPSRGKSTRLVSNDPFG